MSKPNAQYIKLSELLSTTVPIDLVTELDYNGSAPTDQSAAINAYLGNALEKLPIKLIVDIGLGVINSLVTTAGHIDIEGCGWDTGFLSLDAATASMVINNGGPFFPSAGTPGTLVNNFRLANLKLDGNRRHNGKVDGSSNWIPPLYLANSQHVHIENVWIYDQPTYAMLFNNCADVVVTGCRIESPANVGNCDGLHFDGPASDIRISNCCFTTGDDSIALNCPEGYGGDISRATITNCTFNDCLTALRVYSGSTTSYKAKRVAMSNCVGSLVDNGSGFIVSVLMLGYQFNASNSEAVRDVQVSNCTFQSSGYVTMVQDLVGAISYENFIWESPTNANPWISMGGPSTNNNTSINSVNFRNCRIRRTTTGNAAAFLLKRYATSTGHTIGRLSINGLSVENQTGQSYSAIPYLLDAAGMTISELYIGSLDPTNITALMNPSGGFTNVTKVTGPGVAATGFLIPDAIMDNGCLYYSADTGPGSLCIKKGGAVTVIVA